MLDKLERKYGKYAIKNLMKYVVVLYVLGYIVDKLSMLVGVDLFTKYLQFNVDAILRGQIWRIVTFLIQPLSSNIFFLLISVWLYYSIGNTLERTWGAFRFNVFYFCGVLFNIASVVILYILFLFLFGIRFTFPLSLQYINLSMFCAFATLYSETTLLLYFVIPIKIKYLAYIDLALEAFNIVYVFVNGGFIPGLCMTVLFVVSMLNFFIFYFNFKKRNGRNFADIRRQREFTASYNRGVDSGYAASADSPKTITRHKCAVCGRTELDDPDLEFRFCSKCDGNYEYCMEHLYTHTHVVRQNYNEN